MESGPAAQIKEALAKALSKPTPKAKDTQFHPKPALYNAMVFGSQSAVAGVVVAGLRNALSGRNAGFIAPIGSCEYNKEMESDENITKEY
ncbi:hypothetical protein R3P38DRAFT_417180 [Favolaschia claudopus]|uniref:Uncharacterized protein n=1 Tax=Favolaschia claudopus TaxID=2862362 RepID=A0AAV9ZH34_9AGAR